jgi:selenide, water dikinase
VGIGEPDDAAAWKLDDGRALIQTTDFFTPVVDDPHDFGAIAAANALSDVYAMGGEPFLALNLVAFPPTVSAATLAEILRGGAEVVREAGAVIAGGHSIQDKEPKYGLVVTGFAPADRLLTKGGARPGDRLYLTKPLGTGTITTALKRGVATEAELGTAVASMRTLNRAASRAALAAGARGATDITGFGLAGHLAEMAAASGVSLRLRWKALPWLDGAMRHGAALVFPGGAFNNEEFFGPNVVFRLPLEKWERTLLFDPQTSGGLVVAVPPGAEGLFTGAIAREGGTAWEIGDVAEGSGVAIC